MNVPTTHKNEGIPDSFIQMRLLFVIVALLLIHNYDGLSADNDEYGELLSVLSNKCFDTGHIPSWFTYVWCFQANIREISTDHSQVPIERIDLIGSFILKESDSLNEVYSHNSSDCRSDTGEYLSRRGKVSISCCSGIHADYDRLKSNSELGTFIESVEFPSACRYYIKVCSDLICTGDGNNHMPEYVDSTPDPEFVNFIMDQMNDVGDPETKTFMTESEQLEHLERVRAMFHYGYDMYMEHAQPESELRPLTCDGAPLEPCKMPLVTLIDTLDTLVIMGNHTEFRRAVNVVWEYYHIEVFDMDVNVSVFETTIRILGGLLSAHLMAIDPKLNVYDAKEGFFYNDELLILAKDLGERLLPAFNTLTGIPYGTVNLRFGVPKGETEIASTAGAGSLLIEFEVLSSLLKDNRYGDTAYNAALALYSRRSFLGLLGKHVHVGTGQWHETASGVGSNADSFYEYLLKGHLLFHRSDLYTMFIDTYLAVKKHVQVGTWFTEVDMFNGNARRNRVENLQAFWPGMETIIGLSQSAADLLNSFYAVWKDIGFLPEEFDQAMWLGNHVINNNWYPLRPELIESTYYQYRSTKEKSWLDAGRLFLNSIEKNTKTECGFASISNIGQMTLANNMPSYFLSETLKYLYLLFDEDNFIHDRPYIFSTEAHPFDPLQLHMRPESNGTNKNEKSTVKPIYFASPSLPLKCPKMKWYDCSTYAYDPNYRQELEKSDLEKEEFLSVKRISMINSNKMKKLFDQISSPHNVIRNKNNLDLGNVDKRLGKHYLC